MTKLFKNPAVLTTLIANFVLVLGGLIGWFTLSAALNAADVASGNTLQQNIDAKKTAAIVIGVACILVTLVVAKWQKRWLQVVALLLDAFLVFATYNQLHDKATAESYGIHYGLGYWLSLVGAVVATLGCIAVIATVRKNAK